MYYTFRMVFILNIYFQLTKIISAFSSEIFLAINARLCILNDISKYVTGSINGILV